MYPVSENELQYVRGVEESNRLAWNLKDGAAVIGLSYESIRKEIRAGKIRPTKTFKLLSRVELMRYLHDEIQPQRRTKRQLQTA